MDTNEETDVNLLENTQLITAEFDETQLEERQFESVVYSDGTILLHNGQYFIPAGGEAIVLQDGDENYGSFVISDAEDSQTSDVSEQKIIQYIHENEEGEPVVYELSEDNAIQLLQSHELIGQDESQEDDNSGMELLIDEPSLKRIKLDVDEKQEGITDGIEVINEDEENSLQLQLLDCDSNILIENGDFAGTSTSGKKYQFAVLKDNKLQLHMIDSDQVHNLENFCNNPEKNDSDNSAKDPLEEELAAFEESLQLQTNTNNEGIDLMSITGKNLLTGQVVTLDNYFDKIYSAKKSDLNKEFLVENKQKARKFTTKIISIQKPNENEENIQDKSLDSANEALINHIIEQQERANEELCENLQMAERINKKDNSLLNESNELSTENLNINNDLDESIVIPDRNFEISEDNLLFVKRTLQGLMRMESVQRKIMHRFLQVKFIERKYTTALNSFKRSVCYVFGKMELENEETDPNWIFIVDETNNDDSLVDDIDSNELDENSLRDVYGYEEMTSITIINTINKGGVSNLRVKMNQVTKAPTCNFCNTFFKKPLHLRRHFILMHQNPNDLRCHICDLTFLDEAEMNKHKKVHGKGEICNVCFKCFSSLSSLKRHMTVHDKSLCVLECSVCNCRFPNEYSLKKHLVIHTGIRPYSCDKCHHSFVYQSDLNFHKRIHDSAKLVCKVCGREFSRYSNLVRHEEIHKGDGALFKCEICGCSYNYISSLTRHMVQYHITSS